MSFSDSDRSSDNYAIGHSFEKLAARFYSRQGFEILERNWRAGRKELDLIVSKEGLVVFVEVKSASTKKFGHPAERVDQRKISNIVEAARWYLAKNDIQQCDLRFDVVTFENGQLEHFPDAFQASE